MIAEPVSEGPGLNIGASAIKKIGYIPELDGFRGIAALSVVAIHLFMVVIPATGQLPAELSGTFLWMDMFFVLSSFLITALLLKEQDQSGRVAFGAFWMRRALRLLPALYVLLAVHYLYAMYVGLDMKIERESIFFASIYVLNFRMNSLLTSPVSEGLTQLWSLSVEEQFYLVWPVVVAFLIPLRRKLSVVLPVLVGAIVFVSVRRLVMYDDGVDWYRLYTHTDTRADALLVGALLAYLWVHGYLGSRFVRRYVPALAWVAAAFIAWAALEVEMDGAFVYRGGFTLFALAFAVMILACLETDWAARPFFRMRWLCAVGRVAYGLYIWHMVVLLAVARAGTTWSPWTRVVVSLVVSAIATLASWHFVEKPALRLKNRWDRRYSEELASPPAPTTAMADSPDQATVGD